MTRRPLDVQVGSRFGRWTVTQPLGYRIAGQRCWKVLCDCGTISDATSHRLVRGKTTQCRRCQLAQFGQIAVAHRNMEHERYVVAARAMGDSFRAIGEALGISQQRAGQIYARWRREFDARRAG